MDTRVLTYFITVAQTNNITKASQILHISQPTLSRQIIELEETLGTPLFTRENRHLQLTKAGINFQKRAESILRIWDEAKTEAKSTTNELTGNLNLGCVLTNVSSWMMECVAEFQEAFPAVKINLIEGTADYLRQQLDNDLTEILCLIQPVEIAKYYSLPLEIEDEWGLIVSDKAEIANKLVITAADLSDLPLLLPKRNIVQNDLLDQLNFKVKQLNIRGTHEFLGNPLSLIRTGKYAAFAVRGAFDNYNQAGLTFIPFNTHPKTSHAIVWKKNTSLSPVSKAFIDFMQTKTQKKI